MRPLLAAILLALPAAASPPPDPLAAPGGTPVATAEEWVSKVRPATLQAFRETIYGIRPGIPASAVKTEVVRTDPQALGGTATLKELQVRCTGPNGSHSFGAVLMIPKDAKGPVPAFVVLNFIAADPEHPKNQAGLWPVREILARGYATVCIPFAGIDPDRADGFPDGVRAVFSSQPLPSNAWGALSAWGWGASRVLDHLETDPAIDAKRVAIVGHSRAGKAAVWCGAEDTRFAMVVSNNSGCSGAALARGKTGEQIANITTKFPYWFCGNYKTFAGREDELPIDQHQLLALIAPRPLYIASATLDTWSDPAAEFKSCVLAQPVFRLLGRKGLESEIQPPPDTARLDGGIACHLRTGKHDMTLADWAHYLDYADKEWGKPAGK